MKGPLQGIRRGSASSPPPWPSTADVTIVGNGAASIALLAALDETFRGAAPLQIAILGKAPSLGRGNCYHADRDCLLMNTAVDSLSVYPDDVHHFSRWLRKNGHGDAVQFAPRHLYGKYLCEVGLSIAGSGRHEVTFIDGEARTIVRNSRSIMVVGADGECVESAIVVLATGISSSQDCYGLYGCENYIYQPFPTSNFLPKISREKTVIVLGSSLSAVDVAITLRSVGHRGRIYFVSRQGKLPIIKGLKRPHAPLHCSYAALIERASARNGAIGLRDIVRALRKDFSAIDFAWRDLVAAKGPDDATVFQSRVVAARSDIPWLNVLNAHQAELDRIWPKLRAADRTLLMQRYQAPLLHKVAAIPMTNAAQIGAMLSSGALTNVGGVAGVTFKRKRFYSSFHDRPEITADYVINATGPSRRITGTFLSALRDVRLLQENPAGGVVACPHTGRVGRPGGGYDDRLFALGHLTCGIHPIINNISSIVSRSKSMTEAVYRERHSLFRTSNEYSAAPSAR